MKFNLFRSTSDVVHLSRTILSHAAHFSKRTKKAHKKEQRKNNTYNIICIKKAKESSASAAACREKYIAALKPVLPQCMKHKNNNITEKRQVVSRTNISAENGRTSWLFHGLFRARDVRGDYYHFFAASFMRLLRVTFIQLTDMRNSAKYKV